MLNNIRTQRTEAAPTKITNEALQMRDMALKQRLGQLGLSQTEGIDFNDRLQRTERFIREIRSTLLQTESRTKERQWLSMQTSGELDEKRLVESLTGQQNIYRRRAEVEPISGGPLSRPKIIWFCFDVSAR
jgi:hypothetical protein